MLPSYPSGYKKRKKKQKVKALVQYFRGAVGKFFSSYKNKQKALLKSWKMKNLKIWRIMDMKFW